MRSKIISLFEPKKAKDIWLKENLIDETLLGHAIPNINLFEPKKAKDVCG